MSAREELLNTFALWFFTTGKGSREEATRILALHRQELAEELRAIGAHSAAEEIEEGPP